jgi:hypothetical protein
MNYYDLPPDLQEEYADLDEASKRYPLEFTDKARSLRFKQNKAVRFAMDALCHSRVNLNHLCIAAQREGWPLEDVRMFYRMSGYSLCGFLEIFIQGDNFSELPEESGHGTRALAIGTF